MRETVDGEFDGRERLGKIAHDFLASTAKESANFAIVGYKLQNTLSETGSVKRGICKAQNGYIKKIVECKVERTNNEIFATELETGKTFACSPDELVSMNMICFTPKVFQYLDDQFQDFCQNASNLQSGEFLIPTALQQMETAGQVTIKQLSTAEKWIGMTYKEDKQFVVDELEKLVRSNKYPAYLK